MIKKIIFTALLLLTAVIVFNTLMFNYQRPTGEPQSLPVLGDTNELIERLSQALQFKTISTTEREAKDNQSELVKFHQFLAQAFPLVSANLSLTKINDYSLLYYWQGQNSQLKPMMLLAHQDVVPVAQNTLERWQHPPFAGYISDDSVFGRGALDIKSALMGQLEAIESLLATGFKPQRTIYLAYGHDEEIGGSQGAKKIAQHLLAQGVQFEYILDEGGSILENGVIPSINTPVAVIGIAEKGYVSLELTVEATGGHSSMPPPHTAVGILSQAIVNIENHPLPANLTFSAEMFANIGPKMALVQKIIFANMWLTKPLVELILSKSNTTNATIRTTTAVTMIQGSVKDNILPNIATAVVNFRLMPSDSVNFLVSYITDVISDDRVTISIRQDFQPGSAISSTNSLGFKVIEKTIAQIEQDPELVITPYLVVGATDARHYEKLSNNIYRFTFNRYSPASLKQMHGINEQITIKDYIEGVKFYQQLLLNSQ